MSSSAPLTIQVSGMSCAVCQGHVTRALESVPGVTKVSVNLLTHTALVMRNPQAVSEASLLASLRAAGYDGAVLASAQAVQSNFSKSRARELGRKKRQAFLCLLAACIGMIVSMPLMHSASHDPLSAFVLAPLDTLLRFLFPWLYSIPPAWLIVTLSGLTAFVLLGPGSEFFVLAARSLIARRLDMNVLVALGAGASVLLSVWTLVFSDTFEAQGLGSHVYFEAALFIVAFLKLGRFLEARATHETLSALGRLSALRPSTVRRVLSTTDEEVVPLADLRAGETVKILPHDRVAVDGTILQGASSFDESLLTGESLPVVRGEGERVLGGSLNGDGTIHLRVDQQPGRGMLDDLVRLAAEAQSSRPAIQELADRFSGFLIPLILLIALTTGAVWYLFGGEGGGIWGLYCAISVLVISCPCAMGLATPIALMVTAERAARDGVLIKGGSAIEQAARVSAVVLDKTGTLTAGRPTVTSIVPAVGSAPDEVLRLAASAIQDSRHPLAQAVVSRAKQRGLTFSSCESSVSTPGAGVRAVVEEQHVLCGNRTYLESHGVSVESLPEGVSPHASLVFVAKNGLYLGLIVLSDTLLPHAAKAVLELKALGLQVSLASGDRASAVEYIAAAVGIPNHKSALSPRDKLLLVQELQGSGHRVAMVGDGANDALALARAELGIAIAQGVDLASHHADITLLRAEPLLIPRTISLARKSIRVMKQNLLWAAGYNLICIPIAAGALYPLAGFILNPMLASAAMALSSLCVVLNSLRLRRSSAKP